jgi:hypothetical protein
LEALEVQVCDGEVVLELGCDAEVVLEPVWLAPAVELDLELHRIHKFFDNSSSSISHTCRLCNGTCKKHILWTCLCMLLLNLLVAVVLAAGVELVMVFRHHL